MTTHTTYTCDRCSRQLRGHPATGWKHMQLRLGYDAMPDGWFELRVAEAAMLVGMSEDFVRHYCPGCGRTMADIVEKFGEPKSL